MCSEVKFLAVDCKYGPLLLLTSTSTKFTKGLAFSVLAVGNGDASLVMHAGVDGNACFLGNCSAKCPPFGEMMLTIMLTRQHHELMMSQAP